MLTVEFIRLVMCDDDCLFESKLNDLNYCLFGVRASACVWAQNHTKWIIYDFYGNPQTHEYEEVLRQKQNNISLSLFLAHLPSIIKPCKQVLEHGLSSLFCNRIFFTLIEEKQKKKKRSKERKKEWAREKEEKKYFTCE